MNKPLYKIVKALNHNDIFKEGDISEDAKHRINRTGYIIKLTKGMGFRFLYEETEEMLKTSIVKSIVRCDKKITIYTLNTIYVLEEVI